MSAETILHGEHPGAALLADDGHDQRLAAEVAPRDWVNPTPDGRYNLVVIGAGTAGLVAAAGAAGLGAKVALIERHLMGGDCLNAGCVPSKGLIAAARRAAQVRDAGDFGVHVEGSRVDFAAVMERMRSLRADIGPHDGAERFRDLGIDVFRGQGVFTGSHRVEVAGATLDFRKAVIATGARAAAPPIPGLADTPHLTNETLFTLTELPRRLLVLGAGPIGCEMAQSFARFGAEVHVVEMGAHVLMREDADAAAVVQAALLRDGVRLHLSATTTQVAREGDETVLTLEEDGRTVELRGDALLVSVGRAPNVDGLGLDAAGVEHDARQGVRVDDTLRTSNRDVFAAGDVASRYKFTHTADFLARIVIRNALFGGRAKASALTVPWATYTDPEVAHVGLYPADAEERGIAIDTYEQPLSGNDRALLEGETEGFVKVHTRKGKDTIVGATLVGPHAGDLISEVSVAMAAGAGLGTLGNTIHPYPTTADAIRRLGDAYSRTRLTPLVARLMAAWLRWRR